MERHVSDRLTRAQRSANMAAIRSRGTSPELKVATALRRLGWRFTAQPRRYRGREFLHRPDVILPSRKVAIFVNGCFWHGHGRGCRRPTRVPPYEYWRNKIRRNRRRDAAARKWFARLGWRVLVVWECQIPSGGPPTRLLAIGGRAAVRSRLAGEATGGPRSPMRGRPGRQRPLRRQ